MSGQKSYVLKMVNSITPELLEATDVQDAIAKCEEINDSDYDCAAVIHVNWETRGINVE